MIAFFDILAYPLSIAYTIFFYLVLQSFLPLRDGLVWKFLALGGCWVIDTIIIYPNDPVVTLGVFFLLLIHMFLFYQGFPIEKISAVFIFYPILIAINYMTLDIGRLICSLSPWNTHLYETIIYTLSIMIRIPFWAFIYFAHRKWIAKAVKVMTFQLWITVDVVLSASFIGIFSVLILFSDSIKIDFIENIAVIDKPYLSYLACIACIVTNLGCLLLISRLSKSIQSEMEIQNLKYQEAYYRELEASQTEVRKLRHDMNHHLSVMSAFLKNKNDSDAEAYFETLNDEISVQNREFCKNSVINAVINAKYNLAEQNQIEPFLNIDLGHMDFIDSISLCSLFANTLDNAIEAASKLETISERKISLKARYKDGYFSYEITNTKRNSIQKRNNKFLSGKQDGSRHGFGLEKVKDIVDEYSGTIDISYTDNTFTVVILIKE